MVTRVGKGDLPDLSQEQEIQELLHELERLRQRLHSFVGSEYRPERLQEARELSDRIDEMVVRYTRLVQVRRDAGAGTGGGTVEAGKTPDARHAAD